MLKDCDSQNQNKLKKKVSQTTEQYDCALMQKNNHVQLLKNENKTLKKEIETLREENKYLKGQILKKKTYLIYRKFYNKLNRLFTHF